VGTLNSGFIESGTPCDRCHIALNEEADRPTVVETDHGQITAHWACLPPEVQEQVEAYVKRETSRWN
jgi:hypothetical protein